MKKPSENVIFLLTDSDRGNEQDWISALLKAAVMRLTNDADVDEYRRYGRVPDRL